MNDKTMTTIRHANARIPARLGRIRKERDGWAFATAKLPSGQKVLVSRRPGCKTWSSRL